MSPPSPAPLRIAAAQINLTLGDLSANARRILAAVEEARQQGANVLVTPEVALCGYPPEDLLLRPDFLTACDRALSDLAEKIEALGDITLIVGHPLFLNGASYNAATVLRPGRARATYRKMLLPNHEVFDEYRYFSPGDAPLVVDIGGVACGIAICEDIWQDPPARLARAAGAELLLVLNASPFHIGKSPIRFQHLASRARENGFPALYVNLVGGQDELVFDGGSFALNRAGEMLARLPQFQENMLLVDYRAGDFCAALPHPAEADVSNAIAPDLSAEEEVWQALTLGIRDYVEKNRFPGVLLGLSGGIDSALTLALAVDALGKERVRSVTMPSPYTAQMSLDDALAMTEALGTRHDEIGIEPVMRTFETLLAPHFSGLPADTAEENIQARARGMILMAISNKTGELVLTTGNKSEMAVGYCTLYGDMAGGFSVLKDVPKTLVYRLARYRNRREPGKAPIPENIIRRPPSAELKPGQTDQDSLPPYEILDAIIEGYMEENKSVAELIRDGLPREDVALVIRLLHLAEYKRRQAPVGIRVTPRGFGKDWRYPITNRYLPQP
ncbi:MAG: NAD+ synthase [Zoogloeaceae bacterium]|jgi:NAD+ synthase/NAD+ synthase (glutamine-hydrolysing)|nr:NAD+ synthase [Zoogloeaceae bacterium]